MKDPVAPGRFSYGGPIDMATRDVELESVIYELIEWSMPHCPIGGCDCGTADRRLRASAALEEMKKRRES